MRDIKTIDWNLVDAVCLDWVGTLIYNRDDSLALLQHLEHIRRPVFVLSSGLKEKILRQAVLYSFDRWITEDRIIDAAEKVHGTSFKALAERLHSSTSRLFVVDDELDNVRGALRAGVEQVAWRDEQFEVLCPEQAYYIRSLRDLCP